MPAVVRVAAIRKAYGLAVAVDEVSFEVAEGGIFGLIGPNGRLFFPTAALPPYGRALARVVPLTYVVSLLRGIWTGDRWLMHVGDIGALIIVCLVCAGLAARVFRWD